MTDTVSEKFSKGAAHYDQHAEIQRIVALQVAGRLMQEWRFSAGETCYPKQILDIGCGTGFVTQGLAEAFSSSEIYALDLSEEMLKQLKKNVPSAVPILADASKLPFVAGFDLIASSMCLQWMENPSETLEHWRNLLLPHGVLCVSLPVEGTFKEWRERSEQIGRTCKLNEFPSQGFVPQDHYHTQPETLPQKFDSSQKLVRHFALTGAGARIGNQTGHKSSANPFLWQELDREPITVTWNILYILARNTSKPLSL